MAKAPWPKHPPPECPFIRHLRRCTTCCRSSAAPTTTASTTRSVTECALCWKRWCWMAAIYHVQEPASLVIRWLLLPELFGSRKAFIVAGGFQRRHEAQKPETPLITKVRRLASCQTGNSAGGPRRKHPRFGDLGRPINRKPRGFSLERHQCQMAISKLQPRAPSPTSKLLKRPPNLSHHHRLPCRGKRNMERPWDQMSEATGAQTGSKSRSPGEDLTHRSPSRKRHMYVQRPRLAHCCQSQNGSGGPCELQMLTLPMCECDPWKDHECGMKQSAKVTCTCWLVEVSSQNCAKVVHRRGPAT